MYLSVELPGQRAFAFNIWLTLPKLSLESLGQLALPQTGTSGFDVETVCGPWVTMWEASAQWTQTLQARHCIKNVTYIPVNLQAAPLRASHIPFAAALGAPVPRLLGEGRSQVYLLSEPCQQCETYLSENRKTRFTNWRFTNSFGEEQFVLESLPLWRGHCTWQSLYFHF